MFWIQHSLISTENIMTLALDVTGDVGGATFNNLCFPDDINLLVGSSAALQHLLNSVNTRQSMERLKNTCTCTSKEHELLNIKVNESSDNNIFSLSERHYQPRMCSLNTINLDSESEFHVFVWLWCRKIILQRCISFKQIKINDFHLYQSLHESQILPNSSF